MSQLYDGSAATVPRTHCRAPNQQDGTYEHRHYTTRTLLGRMQLQYDNMMHTHVIGCVRSKSVSYDAAFVFCLVGVL